MSRVDIVLIGRNEGDRLVRALAAAVREGRQVVYVDSGSRDDSVAAARRAGAVVVELDTSAPFTAARGRNAGFAALGPERSDYVQFLDGDCAVIPGFLEAGAEFLDAHPGHGLVTGWANERDGKRNFFKRLLDLEWHGPVGPIRSCGGNMMVRSETFEALGGFDGRLIGSEDEDFCRRIEKSGWKLERIPVDMCLHDGGDQGLRAWWKRCERAGHGFAEIGLRHPEHYRAERRRALIYGLILPLTALKVAFWATPAALLLLLFYPLNFVRIFLRLLRSGQPTGAAAGQALLLALSKFPNIVGMGRYWLRRLTRAEMTLIEYK